MNKKNIMKRICENDCSIEYILIKKADDPDIPIILSAYNSTDISKYISIDEKNYWRYITNTENVYFYKIVINNRIVATIHLETVHRVLYMDIVVFSEYQNRGIGLKILMDIQNNYFSLEFDKICVSIDESNMPSIKLFERAGFVFVGKEKELLEYEYTNNPTLG